MRPVLALAVCAVLAGLLFAGLHGRGGRPHVPPAVQASLPVKYSLGNLCPDASTPPALARRIRAQADTLIRELGRRPDELVTYTFFYADADDVTRDITVRDLAREQIAGLDCAPRLQERIRNAID